MSSGRKSIGSYYSKVGLRTILRRDFLSASWIVATIWSRMLSAPAVLPAAKLAALRRAALSTSGTAAARTLVLVTEDEAALFQIIGRHLDCHPVTRQSLDPVLLHLAGSIGNDLMSRVQLDAVAGIGEDFSDQSFELDQLFFSHVYLQVDRRLMGDH